MFTYLSVPTCYNRFLSHMVLLCRLGPEDCGNSSQNSAASLEIHTVQPFALANRMLASSLPDALGLSGRYSALKGICFVA